MASLQCYPDQSNYNYIKPVGTTATHTYVKDTYEQDTLGKNTSYGTTITPSYGTTITPSHGGYGTTLGYTNATTYALPNPTLTHGLHNTGYGHQIASATHGLHNNGAGYGHQITSAAHGHHNNAAGHGHQITSAAHGHDNNTAGHGHHSNAIAAHGHHNGHGITKTHSHSEYSHVKPAHGRRQTKVKKDGCSGDSSDSCSDSDRD